MTPSDPTPSLNIRNVHGPRQATPAPTITGAVPAYASSCPDVTAYWSACQCFSGIVATTVTVTASTPPATSSTTTPEISTTTPESSTTTTPESSTTTTPESSTTTTFESSTTTTFQSSTTTTSKSSSSTTPTSTGTACVPTVILPEPTTIFTAGDDLWTPVTLPFPIGVFGAYDTVVYVSINGRLSLYEGTGNYLNGPLPDNQIPALSMLAFYDDLIVVIDTTQAVAYQVFGSDPGNRTVTFEWVTIDYDTTSEFYHFTASFQEALPGIVEFRYYTTVNEGSSATVGAQNLLGTNNLFVQYSFNTAGNVQDKTFVRLDTTGAGTFTVGTFETENC
ncbi:hypothetical protein EsH8_VIII_000231 [Colletotrichum jinshuiense]